MISSYRGFTGYTRMRSFDFKAAANIRPPYWSRGVAPTMATDWGLSILWMDAIWSGVQSVTAHPQVVDEILRRRSVARRGEAKGTLRHPSKLGPGRLRALD